MKITSGRIGGEWCGWFGNARQNSLQSRRWSVVCCALFAVLWFGSCASAADLTVDGLLTVQDSGEPTLRLDTTGGAARKWNVAGNNSNFKVVDVATGFAPFRIRPAAPDNSLVIDPNGKVGFGTFSPAANLHIIEPTLANLTLRLESGRTWDWVANQSQLVLADNGSFSPFTVEANTPSYMLYLSDNDGGHVGMGTNTPDANSRLDIRSSLLNGVLLKRATADPHYLRIENSGSVFRCGVQGNGDTQFGALTSGKGLALVAGGTGKVVINASGQISFGSTPPAITTNALVHTTGARLTAAGVWTNASSRTLKQDIEPITSEEARDTVRALQPVGYRYKNELDERYVGFIAEDVPELVATNDRKSLASMDITAVLTKVVQDQDKQLSQQQQLIEQQQAALKELTRQMAELKQMVADSRVPSKE